MGEKTVFQPLSSKDRRSVILYRTGIVLSAILLVLGAFLFIRDYAGGDWQKPGSSLRGYGVTFYILALYLAVGMSVFFIHLYIAKFRKFLKRLYYVSLAALLIPLVAGNGDIGSVIFGTGYGPLFLLPLSGCLGFITAKEAFCFRLNEGYLLAIIMPIYILLLSVRVMSPRGAAFGLILIAGLMVLFTIRKVPMPMHFDIGDKSAYEP
ncbi:MAG: DUF2301 domain-containing membrane protein [Nitrospirota bacterium]|nr:DUF2301 domain-containing membrane protein [Nitrospirota bacterium]